ncbi:hypothetical protein CLOACE_21730 [Clostridium acetireducens DSM 10703]|jgi:hypothetical protein|uniref:Uncharacterized protein n=1 Tax=Clostridium acetireducens DSM 10703 TaxID=1121290 RepID=A0A1E8EVT4_9CLOT|nr:hypothetical protein CLOACE_21730 [Clostridium acetireducens DSM 10703]
MKVDISFIMQLTLVLSCILSIFTYIKNLYRNNSKKLNKFVKVIFKCALEYSKKLIIKYYMSYEKYEIWRYCVHFKLRWCF